MAITAAVLSDTPEGRVIEEKDPSIKYRSIRFEPKAGTSAANQQTIADRAVQALTANDAFLALASPTNAQTLAQVQRLTRETTALIRMALGLIDDISGT